MQRNRGEQQTDDGVQVMHSICQQIWKTQQWPQDWKRLVFFFFFFFFYAFLICKAVKKNNPLNQKPYVSINLFALIQNRSNRAVTEKAVATGLLLF